MDILKNIAGRLFAAWAALTFTLSLLVVALPAWFIGVYPEPKRSVAMYHLLSGWMKFWFVVTGVRRTIKGREHFKRGENYVVVCNHNTFMDVPLASPGIPAPNKTIAKVEMSRIPIFGITYIRGSVLVNRKSEESRKASYAKMKEVLDMGLHMCIYPEGTRNKTGEPLQPFHDGAFRLATETGKAVIPALMFNTAAVMPTNKSFYFWPQRVQMHFLPQVSATGKTTKELKEEIFEKMRSYYMANRFNN